MFSVTCNGVDHWVIVEQTKTVVGNFLVVPEGDYLWGGEGGVLYTEVGAHGVPG